MTRLPGRSMRRLCLMKKSVPRMGLDTSANAKEWVTLKLPNWRAIGCVPKVRIDVPLAA